MEMVALGEHPGHAAHLLGNTFVGHHLVLEPVTLFLIPEGRHQVCVIREIVQAVERRDVVEAFYQHSLFAQGVVIERTVDFVHPLFLRPGFGGTQQQAGHLQVIDGVEPAETSPFLVVAFIVSRIHHAADPAHHFISPEGQPHLAGTIPQGRDLGERLDLVGVQGGDILRAVPVQAVRELHKAAQVLARGYFNDTICFHR